MTSVNQGQMREEIGYSDWKRESSQRGNTKNSMNTQQSQSGMNRSETSFASRDVAADYKFEEGQKRANRNLEALRFEDAVKWKQEVKIRYLDRRILDSHNLPEPERLRLQDEWRKARDSGLSQ